MIVSSMGPSMDSYLARMTVSDMILQMHWLQGARVVSLMDEQGMKFKDLLQLAFV